MFPNFIFGDEIIIFITMLERLRNYSQDNCVVGLFDSNFCDQYKYNIIYYYWYLFCRGDLFILLLKAEIILDVSSVLYLVPSNQPLTGIY